MIERYIQRLEQFLQTTLDKCLIPADTIRSAIHYALFPGGKRMRPVLVYLTGDLFDVDVNILDVIAASIEVTHCYSLIHDDLPAMDNDDLRRGKPSCHKAYDEATAILTGDGMQALAIELLLSYLPSRLNPSQVIAVTHELVKCSGVSGMVSGQSLDLSELTKPTLTQDQLEQIHYLKTGRLILGCFEMVLATQNTIPEDKKNTLRTYAQHIGLVFQMQDDYLDHYAPANILGKNRSSDLANEKNTFATLFTKKRLEEEIAMHYKVALNSLSLFNEKGSALIELTNQLQERTNPAYFKSL